MIEKPAKLNIIGTTILIGGVWSVFGSICLTYFTGFICLPITVFWFASGVHNILKGLQMSRKDETGIRFVKRCAYLLLAQVLTLDVLGACLGGLVLFVLDDPQVRAYYAHIREHNAMESPTPQHTPNPLETLPDDDVVHPPTEPLPVEEPLSSVVWSTEESSKPTGESVVEDSPPRAPDVSIQSGYQVATWSTEPSTAPEYETHPVWETVPNTGKKYDG